MSGKNNKTISYDHIYLSYAENIKTLTSKLLKNGQEAFAQRYIDIANSYLALQGTNIRIIANKKEVAIKIK